eukprot:TRINITY_DN5120_c0_g1_i1.p1 TRINITY_DN5120_c0_g1~~TRINITY_DN5120_c0_g1_i1.p1  ORF type:complete len:109 (+),score=16.25 TRINITY_DN5120_c0_g1_i1:393-719(+)
MIAFYISVVSAVLEGVLIYFHLKIRSGSKKFHLAPDSKLKYLDIILLTLFRTPVIAMFYYHYQIMKLSNDHPPHQIEESEEYETIFFIVAFVLESIQLIFEHYEEHEE